jgi:hypothetical protein
VPIAEYTLGVLKGRRAAIAAALAVAAVAVVTAGCGGGSSSSPGLKLDPVSAAATKTENAGAAKIRFAISLDSPALPGKKFQLRGTGALDGKSVEMNFKLASLLTQMGLPAGAENATMAQLQHATLTEIALEQNGGYVIYMRFPAFISSQLPGGKQWMKLDLTKLGKSAGVNLSQLMSGTQLEPGDMLSMLKGEGATVQALGPATTDGVATTHYRVKIDMAKALQSKGVTSPLLKGIAAKLKTIPEDVWIGKDGLVRRLALNFSIPQGPAPARMGMTMDFSDYGAHLSITAPPSSQVFDATQLAQSGLGSTH